jgi:hypothetical protein
VISRGVSNARGTGLAAQALSAGGRRFIAAFRARSFLVGLQEGCASDSTRRGAVPNTGGFYDPMFTTPRSTAFAILGLSGSDFVHLSGRGSKPGALTVTCPKTKP